MILSESETPGTDNDPSIERFSTIMRKAVESPAAPVTPKTVASRKPVPSFKEETGASNEVENVIVGEHIARPDEKNEEEKYAGEEVAKIMGDSVSTYRKRRNDILTIVSVRRTQTSKTAGATCTQQCPDTIRTRPQ